MRLSLKCNASFNISFQSIVNKCRHLYTFTGEFQASEESAGPTKIDPMIEDSGADKRAAREMEAETHPVDVWGKSSPSQVVNDTSLLKS